MTSDIRALRWLLAIVALSLFVAAAIHAGYVFGGAFDTAAWYEAGIGVVLLVGLGISLVWPSQTWWAALLAQAIAIVGASIGLYLALIGVAPSTALDLVYHVVLVIALAIGLALAWRLRDVGLSTA